MLVAACSEYSSFPHLRNGHGGAVSSRPLRPCPLALRAFRSFFHSGAGGERYGELKFCAERAYIFRLRAENCHRCLCHMQLKSKRPHRRQRCYSGPDITYPILPDFTPFPTTAMTPSSNSFHSACTAPWSLRRPPQFCK